MPWGPFIDLFSQTDDEEKEFVESLFGVLEILKEKYVELKEDCTFFVSVEEPFMKDEAVDDVFIPKIPFGISSRMNLKMNANI